MSPMTTSTIFFCAFQGGRHTRFPREEQQKQEDGTASGVAAANTHKMEPSWELWMGFGWELMEDVKAMI